MAGSNSDNSRRTRFPKHPHTKRLLDASQSAQPIQRSLRAAVFDICVDVFLLAMSLLFFAFGLTVRSYDQASTQAHPHLTRSLIDATEYGPSVFPILFAGIMGRTAHSVFIWKLGKGEYIGTLDLLAGSTSLTNAVTTQFKLRFASLLGIALIFIWTFSPFGGQASLRVMTTGLRWDKSSVSFSYMTTNSTLAEYQNSERASMLAIVNALFTSSLLSTVTSKRSTTDLWGNVKIPLIEHYENTSTPNAQGWFNTSKGPNVYSSLVGVPISNVNDSSLVYIVPSLETKYFHIDCSVSNSFYPPYDGHNISQGSDNYTLGADGLEASMWSMDNSTIRVEMNPAELVPRTFSYNMQSIGGSLCSVTTSYIESEVGCIAGNCSISKIRRSRLSNPPPAFTFDKYSRTWGDFASAFVTSIVGHPGEWTPVQSYLVNPDDPLAIQAANGYAFPNITASVSNETFSIRLGQLINGYWDCLNGRHVISGGVSPDIAFIDGKSNAPNIYALDNTTSITGTKSFSTEVIQCNYGWLFVLCLASLMLVVAVVANFIIRHFLIQTPDVMLNISSLAARNNQYIPVPSTGTYADASDRAKRLRNLRVQFGDVESWNNAGKLAIALIDHDRGFEVTEGRKQRLYE